MKTRSLLTTTIAAAVAASSAAHVFAGDGIQNLALGRDVSIAAGTANGAALSTLTDGLFLPAGTHWQSGTVWWSGTESIFEIDLGGTVEVMGAVVQADNNDTYRMWYRDLGSGSYVELWTVGAVGGAGMRTRPNPGNNGEIFYFGSSVLTDSIRIGAIGGDGAHSLSEVQAWGVVPAPGVMALLALGGGLVRGRRR
ncbi:MAG: hypothetical protein GC172_00835 [Phycisphaera sp.]|nr:hypothetical protein [Phycisphaera sp.]